jgi:hypothetical protein
MRRSTPGHSAFLVTSALAPASACRGAFRTVVMPACSPSRNKRSVVRTMSSCSDVPTAITPKRTAGLGR